MYNRAKRNFDVSLGSTPGCVGPGSYSFDSELERFELIFYVIFEEKLKIRDRKRPFWGDYDSSVKFLNF